MNESWYESILAVLREWAPRLKEVSGCVADVGVRKQWLTDYDVAVERALASVVAGFGEGHAVFAEEEHNEAREAEHLWVVDPISGTQNFVRGIPAFSMVVAHVYRGKTRFAAVMDPCHDELFSAIEGQGLHLNGQPVTRPDTDGRVLINYQPSRRHFSNARSGDLLAALSELGLVRIAGISEGLQYAYVAMGRFSACCICNNDVFPAYAGRLLVEESGGVFTDFAGNDLTWIANGVVAGTAELHERIHETLGDAPRIADIKKGW